MIYIIFSEEWYNFVLQQISRETFYRATIYSVRVVCISHYVLLLVE